MKPKTEIARVIRLLALALIAAGCADDRAAEPTAAAAEPATAPARTVSIMTFNVLNLFDNVDAPGKDDKEYLPLADKQHPDHIAACNEIERESWRKGCLTLDWSDAVIEHKLETIAAVIRTVDDGRGPDIIAFQEVENASMLDQLSYAYLLDLNYGPAILIEGQDARGVDVGFLSRLPATGQPVLHEIDFPDHSDRAGDTRGILEATFMLPDGAELTGFAVHFPAPYHPPEMRVVAYERLNELRDRLPDDRYAFAAGDFNTTSTEMRDTGVVERLVKPHWVVAHEFCRDCPGTYYYAPDDNWSFLDMILFAPARGEKTTWRLRTESVRLVTDHPAQLTPAGTPLRYDAATGRGVSDHLPLLIELESTRKQ
ncbi:MAG: endonuclease/exonuclease/phosphatase family protein [Woeseiaceae bacterium]|nr:endonuclease/exonuclease/phosphatase family protein [Woeseiaceae bacterium]